VDKGYEKAPSIKAGSLLFSELVYNILLFFVKVHGALMANRSFFILWK